MAKVTPVLWKHKTNSDGHSAIYLRIYAAGKTKYKSLSVYIHERHWNEGQRRVRKSHRRHGEINSLIQGKLAEAEDVILERQREGKPLHPRHVKRVLEAKTDSNGSADFFAYADAQVERYRRNGQVATSKRYGSVIRKMRDWAGGPLEFEELTPQLLRDFETHLLSERGNKRTTVARDLGVIRAVLYQAIRDGLARQEKNPFFHFQIRHGTPERDRLTLGQLRKIEALDLGEGTLLWHVRNYFLFALYAAGVRYKDVALMERSNVAGGRLVYQMSKTEKARSVKLLPPAERITRWYLEERHGQGEPWLFPILDGRDLSTPEKRDRAINSGNSLANAYLSKITDRADVDCHVTFHVARHSFASIAQRKGWDVAEISQALGHSSLKVTEQYLKGFDDTDLDNKMVNLFGTNDGGAI